MKNFPFNLKGFTLTEEQFNDLAGEFYGTVVFPAGNHQEAFVSFPVDEPTFREQFIRALSCFKRTAP